MNEAVVLERVVSPRGELVLRKRGDVFELISNGMFLMDNEDVHSEELLVRYALDAVRNPTHVLIGGLGFGASAREALRDPRVQSVTVVEIESTVIEWYAKYFRAGQADDRLTIVHNDFGTWLVEPQRRYDVICMDVDNGPDWHVQPANAALYMYRGLRAIRRLLTDNGCVAFWSASVSQPFERRLRDVFHDVYAVSVPARTGPDDVIYLAANRR